jgi:hypothetical protein
VSGVNLHYLSVSFENAARGSDLRGVRTQAVVTEFKVIFWHLTRSAKENHRNLGQFPMFSLKKTVKD